MGIVCNADMIRLTSYADIIDLRTFRTYEKVAGKWKIINLWAYITQTLGHMIVIKLVQLHIHRGNMVWNGGGVYSMGDDIRRLGQFCL